LQQAGAHLLLERIRAEVGEVLRCIGQVTAGITACLTQRLADHGGLISPQTNGHLQQTTPIAFPLLLLHDDHLPWWLQRRSPSLRTGRNAARAKCSGRRCFPLLIVPANRKQKFQDIGDEYANDMPSFSSAPFHRGERVGTSPICSTSSWPAP